MTGTIDIRVVLSFKNGETKVDHDLVNRIKTYPRDTLLSRKINSERSVSYSNNFFVKTIKIDRDLESFDRIVPIYLGEHFCNILFKLKTTPEIKEFYDDLVFYEFLIPQGKIISSPVPCEELKDRAIQKLKEKLPRRFSEKLGLYDGIITGSLPLQCYLGEEWNNADVDIYIHINTFLLRSEGLKLKFLPKSDGFKDVPHKSYMTNLLNIKRISLKKLKKVIYKNLFQDTFHGKDPSILEDFVVCRNLGNRDPGVFEATNDNVVITGTYRHVNEIQYVIKFKVAGTKYDIILTSTTPRHFIQHFDFAFNKIYYDGYVINAYDWYAIHTRCASNNYSSHSDMYQRYKENIERIKKYIDRGFSITI